MQKILIVAAVMGALFASAQNDHREIPAKGSTFNESVWVVDSVTGRPTLRLTQYRDFNRTPTYHLNACFSKDSRHIVFTTYSKGYGSALVEGDVATGDCRVIAVRGAKEKAFSDNICRIQNSDYAASTVGAAVTVYNLKTLEERVLYKAPEGEGMSHPVGSTDGKKIYVNQLPEDPGGGKQPVNRMKILEVEIATGKATVVFSDTSRGKHIVPNPTDPDLLLIDRDFPPLFAKGTDNGKTTRVWILNIKTGALTECRPDNPYSRFQVHSNWSFDGKYVYYQGRAGAPDNKNAHYIGVSDLTGKVVWEKTFPYYYYGHMCSHTQKDVLFTDGLLFPNLIVELDWMHPDKYNVPPITVYGAHNSGDFSLGQQCHPHCHMSPDAQKVTYNKGNATHSDVYILYTDQSVK